MKRSLGLFGLLILINKVASKHSKPAGYPESGVFVLS